MSVRETASVEKEMLEDSVVVDLINECSNANASIMGGLALSKPWPREPASSIYPTDTSPDLSLGPSRVHEENLEDSHRLEGQEPPKADDAHHDLSPDLGSDAESSPSFLHPFEEISLSDSNFMEDCRDNRTQRCLCLKFNLCALSMLGVKMIVVGVLLMGFLFMDEESRREIVNLSNGRTVFLFALAVVMEVAGFYMFIKHCLNRQQTPTL